MVKDADKRHTAVRLDADDLAKLEVIATEQDRSVSWLIRKAVSEFLERQKKK
jgi:predicted transcriptional regulator